MEAKVEKKRLEAEFWKTENAKTEWQQIRELRNALWDLNREINTYRMQTHDFRLKERPAFPFLY